MRYHCHPLLVLLGSLILAGCQITSLSQHQSSSVPNLAAEIPYDHVLEVRPLIFTTDFVLPRHDPLVQSLLEHRKQIIATLELPERELPIRICIFESRQRFEEFCRRRLPEFPIRRAFFVQQGEEFIVLASRGEGLLGDLRHELTHAVLHQSIGDVPIWLDEGLAEYFEPAGPLGTPKPGMVEAIEEMQANNWRPSLARLESLQSVWQLSGEDYRESWLWVHFMLHHQPATKSALASLMKQGTVAKRRNVVQHLSEAMLKQQASNQPGTSVETQVRDELLSKELLAYLNKLSTSQPVKLTLR